MSPRPSRRRTIPADVHHTGMSKDHTVSFGETYVRPGREQRGLPTAAEERGTRTGWRIGALCTRTHPYCEPQQEEWTSGALSRIHRCCCTSNKTATVQRFVISFEAGMLM